MQLFVLLFYLCFNLAHVVLSFVAQTLKCYENELQCTFQCFTSRLRGNDE